MKSYLLFILVFLLCMVSCKKEPDFSYTSERYLELGMPDFNRAWTLSDLGEVVPTLSYIQYNEPLSLPRKGSRKSGKLFDHLISMDNMSFLNNDTLPLYEKAYRIQSYVHVQSKYCDIYTDHYRKEQYYNEELIDLYIFGISITQEMLNLAYKINESDAPGDVKLQSGFPAIQYIHVTMLSDALDKQKNTSLYNAEDLETLGDSIALSLRRNMTWFDTTAVERIKQNMRVVIDSSTSEKIRNEYSDIINTL